MKPALPALVYAPLISPTALHELHGVLMSRDLFIADRCVERTEHLSYPSAQRPQLLRYLFHAASGFITAFVTDHLSSLGDDRADQLAVVGAFLELNVQVIIGGEDFDAAAYQARTRRIDFARLGATKDALESRDAAAVLALREVYPTDEQLGQALLPTYVLDGAYMYPAAAWRAKALLADTEMTPTQVARILTLEGYVNKRGNVVWYAQNVRSAAGDTAALDRGAVAGITEDSVKVQP